MPRSVSVSKLWIWLFAGLIAHSVVYLAIYTWHVAGGMPLGGDFPAFWTAANRVTSGADAYAIYDTETLQQVLDGYAAAAIPALPYPPPLLFLIAPLGYASYEMSLLFWLAATGLFYVLATFASAQWQEFRAAGFPKSWQRIALLFVIASPFALYNIIAGQSGFLMGGLMIAGLAFLSRSPYFAGVCFGLLAMKPQLAMLVPVLLLATHQWRCLLSAALTICVLIGAAMWQFGAISWQIYAHYLDVYTTALAQVPQMMMSLNASLYWVLKTSGVGNTVAACVQVLCFGYACWSVGRARKASVALQGALLVTATFIAAPYIMIYDTTLWILPVLFWFTRGLANELNSFERIAFLLLLLAPIIALKFTTLPIIFAAVLFNHVVLMRRIS